MTQDKTISDRLTKIALPSLLLATGLTYAMPAQAQDTTPTDDKPIDPIQVEPEDQTQDDEAADLAALESELASARRFETELEALLLTDGQLDTAQGDEALIKLAGLATRCGILANNAMHDEVKLVLFGYQARALAALASLEPVDPEQDPSRLEQIDEVVLHIEQLELPAAQPTADYWELLADMARLASSKETPARIRATTEWVLNRYIDQYEDNDYAAEYLLDARLSLAQLLDQRGAQRSVAEQLKRIGKLAPDSPRAPEVERLRESVARLGTTIQFESLSTQLATWRSSDHLGKPVLIHVYADRVESSVRMIDVISRSIVEGSLSGIAVVSLRVGDPVASSSPPPWPTLPVQLEPKGVLDQLGVAALPTLVWLDEKGRLASIGTTPAVLDQFAALKPEEPDQNQTPAPEQEAQEPPKGQPENQANEAPAEPIESAEPAESNVDIPSNQ